MRSRDIALVGIMLAAGAIARYISLFVPGAIVANLTIAFYCLAVILVVPKFREALGIGFIAGVICAVFSHSVFPLGNLVSEPVGAVVCLCVYRLLKDRTRLAPGITTAIATAFSGYTFIAVICVFNHFSAGWTAAAGAAFAVSMTPIVLGALIANTVISMIIALPAANLMQKAGMLNRIDHKNAPPAAEEAVISLQNAGFTYAGTSAPAMSGISLNIRQGEFVLVSGSSGSGKTTFCRALSGILLHAYGGTAEGEIAVSGRFADEYGGVSELSREACMIFDDADAQLIFTTVEEEIRTGLESGAEDLSDEEIDQKLEEIYALTDTKEIKDRPPHELSGGQKQRVAIAAALSRNTPILISDEATSELDRNSRLKFYRLFREMADSGRTVVLVDHMAVDVLPFATRLVCLDKGKMTYDGVPDASQLRLPDSAVLPEKKDMTAAVSGLPPAVRTENLVHTYESSDKAALCGVSVEIPAGCIVAILGENGSGKTTFVKHLNGLLKPESGYVEILGKDISGMKVNEISKDVGLVFQNPDTMLFESTCEKEIAFGLKNIRRGSGKEAGESDDQARIIKALDIVGLSGKKDTNPRSLSRGERQCLALACILAMDQPIVILDEPTTGLDMKEAYRIMSILIDMRNEGKTILMVTHDPEMAEAVSDRIISMADGHIIGDVSGLKKEGDN